LPFLTSGLLAHATHAMGVKLAQQCQQAQWRQWWQCSGAVMPDDKLIFFSWLSRVAWGALAKLESHFLLTLCNAIPVSQDKNSVAGHFITKMIILTSTYHFNI
jgi:hypothetical protein